jgi:hypothetical protein
MKKKERSKPSSDSPEIGKREFADSTNAPVPSRKRIGRTVRRIWKRYGNRLIIVVTGALIITAIVSVVANRESNSQEASSGPDPLARDLSNKNQVLDDFLISNLGALQAEQLQSIRIFGQIIEGETRREFSVVKKRPNLAYLKLYLDRGVELTYGMDGGRVWRRIDAPGATPEEGWASEEATRDLQTMTYFFSPLIDIALQRRELVESIAFSTELGFDTIAIRFMNERAGVQSVAHLDAKDLSLLSRFDFPADGKVRRSNFSDFQVIEGFRFPFMISTELDAVEQQVVEIDRMTLNPGVISEFFEPPSGLDD